MGKGKGEERKGSEKEGWESMRLGKGGQIQGTVHPRPGFYFVFVFLNADKSKLHLGVTERNSCAFSLDPIFPSFLYSFQ